MGWQMRYAIKASASPAHGLRGGPAAPSSAPDNSELPIRPSEVALTEERQDAETPAPHPARVVHAPAQHTNH